MSISTMPFGPRPRAFAPRLLRVVAVPALVAIALAGCNTGYQCVDGKLYSDQNRDGVFTIGNGNNHSEIECFDAQGMAAGTDATGTGAAEGNSPVGETDAPKQDNRHAD